MIVFDIGAVIVLCGVVLYLFQIGSASALLKRRQEPADDWCPPVSVLKPLRGLDDNLFDNLASFCEQDYPAYEVLFCLQDANDPAYKVAKKVKDKYPGRDITLVVEKCGLGLNPKVNNLIPGYRQARHPLVLISDSNVLVDPGYLREITRHTADPAVGLVSSLIGGTGGRSIGALLENLHLNSFVIGSVGFLDRFLGMPCVIGKSMLMKKDDLDAIGGLVAYKDILAEDFIIGREMAQSGRKVVLANRLIGNVNEYWGVKRFLNRHTRWGKLRWKIGGLKYLSELLANPVFIALLTALSRPSRAAISLAACTGLVKVLGDCWLGQAVSAATPGATLRKTPRAAYVLVPIKDLLIGLLWFVPLVSATVDWRGNHYRIGKDSRLSPCTTTGIRTWGRRITQGLRERFA